MDIKYSVIIPVYNAESTITRCLDSLLIQKRNDIEIITINDGSSDKSQLIINQYIKKYPMIKCIEQSNKGVSVSRNKGLDIAEGKYILFVDSDDFVAENYFELLDSFDDSDLYVFARQEIITGESDFDYFNNIENLSDTDLLCYLLANMRFFPPWNKRYKNSIIKNFHIRFLEGYETAEDFHFSMNYVLHCKKIKAVSNILYELDESNQKSLSRKYRPDLASKLKNIYLDIERMVINEDSIFDNKMLIKCLDYLYVRNVYSCITEEFRANKKQYFKYRKEFICISNQFTNRIGNCQSYFNKIHQLTRYMLKYRAYFFIYLFYYILKGRK
mgnify:CR=1 FL=1